MHNVLHKATEFSLFIVLAAVILYFGKPFLLPITIGCLFALLLTPFAQKLKKIVHSDTLANLLAVISIVLVLLTVFLFFANQVGQLLRHAPAIKELVISKIGQLQTYLEKTTLGNLIMDFAGTLKTHIPALLDTSRATLRVIIKHMGWLFFTFFLSCIYTFFLLQTRHKIHQFILLLSSRDKAETERTVADIQHVTVAYIRGLLTVIFILMILDSIGLYVLGIPYPLLWGIMAGMVTIIPYVGVYIGGFFPFVMALLTDQPIEKAIGVIILFTLMQLLENNILTPYIIGSYVNLNPLFVLTSVFAGGLLWGLPGMILSIPIAAIIKTVCAHTSFRTYVSILESNDKKKSML